MKYNVNNIKNKKLIIGGDIEEIELQLSPSRLIKVSGKDWRGELLTRHLKITDKCKLLLV